MHPKCGTESRGRAPPPPVKQLSRMACGEAHSHTGTGGVSKGRRAKTAGGAWGLLPSHTLQCRLSAPAKGTGPPRGRRGGKDITSDYTSQNFQRGEEETAD